MNLRKAEQKTTLRYLLIGINMFMLLPLALSLFIPDQTLLIVKITFFIFFIFLYFFHEKTQKPELVTHILLIGVYIILTLAVYTKQNADIASIWYLILPLFSSILLTPKQSLKYSTLALLTIFIVFFIYPESMSFMEKFRLFAFSIFLAGTLYILARSRQKAWNETENYMGSLEHKVEEVIEEKEEQEKLLIQTSKLATLGELLSSIAHQWKQPIASISAINMNFRIQEELSENPSEKKLMLVEQLQEQTEFMSRTMDDFRTFFKANDDKTTFELVTASKVLTSMFEKNFRSQNIEINMPVSNSIEVFGYSNMYKQALLNIIVNAKDVIIEKKPSNKNIEVSFKQDDSFGIVTIQDHAGGIPENILDNVFEKSFTTKGEDGSGIGLAMAKEIIEDFCQGKITVENTDNGARFSIYVPLSKV